MIVKVEWRTSLKISGNAFENGKPVKVGEFVEHAWKNCGRGTVVSIEKFDGTVQRVKVLWPYTDDEWPTLYDVKFVSSSTDSDGKIDIRMEAKVSKPINYIQATYKI